MVQGKELHYEQSFLWASQADQHAAKAFSMTAKNTETPYIYLVKEH